MLRLLLSTGSHRHQSQSRRKLFQRLPVVHRNDPTRPQSDRRPRNSCLTRRNPKCFVEPCGMTSSGESANKVVNRLVKDVSRQNALRARRRLFLRIHRFNLDKEEKLAFVTKKKARSIEWYLRERLLRCHGLLSEYEGIDFPLRQPWHLLEHSR